MRYSHAGRANHRRCARLSTFVERMNFDADFMEGLCPNRKCGEADLDLGALTPDGAAVEDTAFEGGVAA